MKRNQSGFTLVEVLVVVAIVCMLVGLLLPAIQSTRETAHRCQCQGHLTQLILAVHNYESVHGIYPPGTIDAKGPILNAQIGYHHNWVIQILPYFEYANTWEAIDKRVGVYHVKQVPLLPAAPRELDCPSSPAPQGNPCYAGVHHDTEKPIDAGDNGMFFLNSRLRIDQVTDGLAQTLFLGEKIPDGWDLHWMSGTRATLRNAGSPINALKYRSGLPAAADRKFAADDPYSYWPDWMTTPENEPETGAEPPGGMAPTDSMPGAPAPAAAAPQFPKLRLAPPTSPGGPGNPLWVGSFSSSHPTGANFAFGDGSVRLLPNETNLTVLQQLANRRDGQRSPLP